MPQLFTYFVTTIFALLNGLLIARLASKLGAKIYVSMLCGFVFMFATNALSYSLTFTQHHASTFFILLALLNVIEKRNFIRNVLLGIYFGIGLLIDIPNFFIMAPILIYAFLSHTRIRIERKITLRFRSVATFILLGSIPLISLFAYYNYQTTGSFTKLGQTIGRTNAFKTSEAVQNITDQVDKLDEQKTYLISVPFQTRNQLNGFYTLLLSDERSWLYYSPVLLLGILGFIFALRDPTTVTIARIGLSVVLMDIVLYSMFGDPWGGWAFGPRYLIPSAAIMAATSGVAIQRLKRNYFFIIMFFALFIRSVYISSLGALTTNAIPPKIEAENFKPSIPYTFKYNLGFINKNQSGNLLFNIWAYKLVSLRDFWYIYIGVIVSVGVLIYLLGFLVKDGNYE